MPAIFVLAPWGGRRQGGGHRPPSHHPIRSDNVVPYQRRAQTPGHTIRGHGEESTLPTCCRIGHPDPRRDLGHRQRRLGVRPRSASAARRTDRARRRVARFVVSSNAHVSPRPTSRSTGLLAVLGKNPDRDHRSRHRPGLRRQATGFGSGSPTSSDETILKPRRSRRNLEVRTSPGEGLQPRAISCRDRRGSARLTTGVRPMVPPTHLLLNNALDEGRTSSSRVRHATMPLRRPRNLPRS